MSSASVSDRVLAELREPHAGTDRLHFNAAGVAPMTVRAHAAGVRTLSKMLDGSLAVASLLKDYEAARGMFAALCNARSQDTAFFQTCAAAITQAAFGIDLRRDDEIVLIDQEYPSNAYPWYRAAERAGAKVIVVKSRDDLRVDTGDVRAAVTPKTRVIACSWVQFSSGAAVDLPALATEAKKVGAWLVTDAIQGLGVIPFDLGAMGVDVACGGTHKWLLGPMGHGFFCTAPGKAEQLAPVLFGAITYGTPDDAVDPKKAPRTDPRRFEPGNPTLLGSIAGAASIDALLQIGVGRVQQEALALRALVVERAAQRGYRVLDSNPAGAGAVQSPIATLMPRTDAKLLVDRLRDKKVSVAPRGGGLRIAPHVHNTAEHIDSLFELLDALDR